jgi:antitoxin component YwqK of YwqJK toxin-antitoxin module
MKFKIFIIALSLACVSTNGLTQTLPTAAESKPIGNAGVDFNLSNKSGEKQGVWIRVYPNGALYYVGTFNSGNPEGQFLYFFETGELMSKIHHPSESDSSVQTTAIHYRTNSSVQSSGFYISLEGEENPVRDGSWGYYNEESKQIKQESYSKGVLNGPYWIKSTKGGMVEEGDFENGELDGLKTTYYDNGNVRQNLNYIAGGLEGDFSVFYSNTMPKIEGNYYEGREHSVWKTYQENGRLEQVTHYSYGTRVKEIKVNGTFEDTFPDGRSKSEYTFRNKLKDGPFRIWYDVGEYVIEDFTDSETGEILKRQVLLGTQVSSEGEYVEGKLDGPIYYYSKKGKLTKTENYRGGELLKTD